MKKNLFISIVVILIVGFFASSLVADDDHHRKHDDTLVKFKRRNRGHPNLERCRGLRRALLLSIGTWSAGSILPVRFGGSAISRPG